ncbi:MAG TPA: class I SAM-dependent methyltransferase [Kofleriaceae bacterium]
MTTLTEAGRELVAAARALGPSPIAIAQRAWVVPTMFHAQERAFASDVDPTPTLVEAIRACAARLATAAALVADASQWKLDEIPAVAGDVEQVTGHHYGNLFSGFSPAHYWDEPTALLKARLDRNGVSIAPGQTVIDAGCGGGRYTVAWKKLGASHVVGVDVSPLNISVARARIVEANIDDVEYREGNVLALEAADASFDVVFSNGVLHHTIDWQKGISELVRVLKPGGLGWLYLIEEPGGLFWEMIDVLRSVMERDSHDVARRALQLVGLPQNRVFYMLDHVMAPINVRLRPDQIEDALRSSGASNVRRLERGADFDRVEQIHRQANHATVKFGVGENRYVFSR